MGQKKDFADQNAHERTPPNRSTERSTDALADPPKTTAHPDKQNPLDRLRYGSAGSGGAEREPGPERP